MAFVTTLFRPFPGELLTAQGVMQSMEGMILAGLMLFNFTSVMRGLASVRREPYMLYSLLFAICMILILSTIPNFGLLARVRIIMLPAIFALIAYRAIPRSAPVSDSIQGDTGRSGQRPAPANTPEALSTAV